MMLDDSGTLTSPLRNPASQTLSWLPQCPLRVFGMGLCLAALLFSLLSVLCCRTSQGRSLDLASPLKMHGDYTIAGLFPIHRSKTFERKSRPEVDICGSMQDRSYHTYHLLQAMRFGVEEINNASALLPNVTLGYEIYDVCSSSANLYATLSLLSQGSGGCPGHRQLTVSANYSSYLPNAVAAIGPDSSENAFTTASLLGIFHLPQISYEATSAMLSQKRTYPSFLRTIPSDRMQVEALVSLLKTFHWIWVAVVGSENAYGHQGLQMLHEAATTAGLCFAYQGFLPSNADADRPERERVVQALVGSRANVTIVFANKRSALPFFLEAIRQNVTGKVWLGTEDWSLAPEIWQVPGIHTIGTVIGVSLKQARLQELALFEAAFAASGNGCAHLDGPYNGAASCCGGQERCSQSCSRFCRPDLPQSRELSAYDSQGAFNVYAAVYALAHGLHRLLGCQAGRCRKDTIYPWQLLNEVKRVDFNLYDRHVYFDSTGNPLTGYDIIWWNWTGQRWSYAKIGSFDRNPKQLNIEKDRFLWHTEDNQVPASVCSRDCGVGEQKVQQGIHRCCFHCVGCPPATFLNRSDIYSCQKCGDDQWAPARSQTCFGRTTVFLPWDDKASVALLAGVTLLLALLAGTAGLFARNLRTPVVRSAGGWLCFAMLGSLACAGGSLYCYFGVPQAASCLLQFPVYSLSFSVCLACMAARSFQIVIIFKVPGLYEAWRGRHGPSLLIGTLAGLKAVLLLLYVTTGLPAPRKNYDVSEDLIVLECASSSPVLPVLGQTYNGLLGLFCFAICYLGKDLPNSYNEAKCISLSLLIYFISFIFSLTAFSLYRGKYRPAIQVASQLASLSGIFGSYFAPKAHVILFRSERNTNEHFQMSIQSYTQRRNTAG